ncbi:MAG TPA: choice-of-anchor tandem repeat GloVer-containing protein [Verrucomicrobiae bacterium]|nr:choice-of-anchor tandem repeat GloVer-containing protein [Verrucomicrobiae bacterium]
MRIAVAVAATAVTMFAAAGPAQAQTFTLLYSFEGTGSGGASPLGPLVRNSQGDLLGTTAAGGDAGYGVFFKLSGGKERVLHSFQGSDGSGPSGLVVRDPAGNFYGTTAAGGASSSGTAYELDEAGILTTLYDFRNYQGPAGGVIRDADGNLYGATDNGGGTACECGLVYKLSATNTFSVLHRFAGGTDGARPFSELYRDSLGNLYGTTVNGGDTACTNGCGVVFKITTAGAEKIMHRFAGPPDDGANPYAGLIRDKAGNFYGTTSAGGSANQGTIFKIDASGNEAVLYSFQGGSDGAQPTARLVFDSAGNLYGTTYAGGGGEARYCSSGCGTVFKLDQVGRETILHAFSGLFLAPYDGQWPRAGLTLGQDGNLYGTTSYYGTVFRIIP